MRNWTLKRLSRNAPKPIVQLSTALELVLGALAGAFAQIFTIPVAVIATRQQLFTPEDGARTPGLFDTAREIVKEDGVTGLWTGLKPGLVLTVNPAITYGVFERVKGILIAAQVAAGAEARLTPARSFVIGVLSKTLATVVTYPYIFVSRLTWQSLRSWKVIRILTRNSVPGQSQATSQTIRNHLDPVRWRCIDSSTTRSVLHRIRRTNRTYIIRQCRRI